MLLFETIIRLIAPHVCIGCGTEEDRLICEGCTASLTPVPSRCYRCKAVTADYAVCADCRRYTPLQQVMVYTFHKELPKELIHHMKYERAQAGVREAGSMLAPLLVHLPEDSVLTYVPTATSRVRQRGYDHARLLAASVAKHGSYHCRTFLSRVGQAHQVGAGRAARLRQLQHAFRPVHVDGIKGRHIVLIDDVLTTGATIESAARVLKRAGAAQVSALVFAQA